MARWVTSGADEAFLRKVTGEPVFPCHLEDHGELPVRHCVGAVVADSRSSGLQTIVMTRKASLALCAVAVGIFGACVRERYVPPEQPYVSPEQPYVPREQMNQVIVTIGDLSTPYSIVGPVEWPRAGDTSQGGPCDSDRLRTEAIARYGHVDAIIGVLQWRDRSQERCSGLAVRFTGR